MKGIFNKIIIFTFIFILLLSNFAFVFASVDYTLQGETVTLPDFPSNINTSHYILIYTDFYPAYQLFVFNNWQDDNIIYVKDKRFLKFDHGTVDLYLCRTNNDTLSWELYGSSYDYINYDGKPELIMYSTDTIYNSDKTTIFYGASQPIFNKPYIANTAEDLATGKFDSLLIIPNDAINNLGLRICKMMKMKADTDNDGVEEEFDTVEKILYKKNLGENLLNSVGDEYWYNIPSSDLGINWVNGATYLISLVNDANLIYLDDNYVCYQETRFTIGRSYC